MLSYAFIECSHIHIFPSELPKRKKSSLHAHCREDDPGVERQDLLPRQSADKHCRDQMKGDGLENISNTSQMYFKDK